MLRVRQIVRNSNSETYRSILSGPHHCFVLPAFRLDASKFRELVRRGCDGSLCRLIGGALLLVPSEIMWIRKQFNKLRLLVSARITPWSQLVGATLSDVRLRLKVAFMAEGKRFGLSAMHKSELWCRWNAGQSLHEIGRAFGTRQNWPVLCASGSGQSGAAIVSASKRNFRISNPCK